MKKLTLSLSLALMVGCGVKAQTGLLYYVNDIKPFEKYYDTVKVWMLVSNRQPGAQSYVTFGYDVYDNYYVPAHWENDFSLAASHERILAFTLYADKIKRYGSEIILWQKQPVK